VGASPLRCVYGFRALSRPREEEDFLLNTVKDAVPAKADPGAKKNKPDESDAELEGLMSEIETDLRTEEFKKIWKNYGAVIITFVVALVLGVAGFQFYRQYETKQRAALAERYAQAIEAVNTGKADDALKQFTDLSKDGGKGYSALARLSQAALLVQKNEIDGAMANYKSLAADPKADPIFRDLATLLRVMHGIDREDPKTLEAELAPLTNSDNAFYLSALELSALLAAKQGDNPRALKALAQISDDPTTPANMRQRVDDLTKLFQSGYVPPAIPVAPAVAIPAAPAPAASSPPPVTTPAPTPDPSGPAPAKP
jgi:hypothetical protein